MSLAEVPIPSDGRSKSDSIESRENDQDQTALFLDDRIADESGRSLSTVLCGGTSFLPLRFPACPSHAAGSLSGVGDRPEILSFVQISTHHIRTHE